MSFSQKIARFFTSIGVGIKDFFVSLPIDIAKGFLKCVKAIGRFFKNFHKRFVDGSIGTKLSHFFIGAGNFYHKQYVKGAIYLLLQIGFIALFILNPQVNGTPIGFKALPNLITLGTHQGGFDPENPFISLPYDNSILMLLFGLATVGLIIVYFILFNSGIKSSYKADLDVREGKKPTTIKEDFNSLLDERFHILMLTPTCLAALAFTILPTLFTTLMAFTNYDFDHRSSLIDWSMSGWASLFDGSSVILSRFPNILGWTVIWAVIATFSNYFGGILLALLINKKEIKLKKLWRTIFIFTIALPQFVSLLAVRNILAPYGPINTMLVNAGIIEKDMEFLSLATNPNTARVAVLIINLWVGVPYTMLQTSGILMNIPTDLYEAATIDGANKNQMFTNITLPYIIFVTTPYLISSFIGNINSFNIIYLLTGGGPSIPGYEASQSGATDLLVTWLYKLTIEKYEYNAGAIIGIITFLITSTLTLITYRRSKAYKEEDTFQ